MPGRAVVKTEVSSSMPDCDAALFKRDLESPFSLPHCGHHFRLDATSASPSLRRSPVEELDAEVVSGDPLGSWTRSPTATPRQARSPRASPGGDQRARQDRRPPVLVAAMDFTLGRFDGRRVGEKITRQIERAIIERAAVMSRQSAGARAGGRARADAEAGERGACAARRSAPAVHLRADRPTTGGVTAIFPRSGRIIAEPKALIARGPRFIEQTSARSCRRIQRAEFLLEHGMIDAVIDRREMSDSSSSV